MRTGCKPQPNWIQRMNPLTDMRAVLEFLNPPSVDGLGRELELGNASRAFLPRLASR